MKKSTSIILFLFVAFLILFPLTQKGDAPQPAAKTYKILHFQGMGSYNWFKLIAWKKADRPDAILEAEKLVKEIKSHGYPDSSAVMWLSSGKAHHRNLNRKTPWYSFRKDGVITFDFSRPNKKFWKVYRLWLEIHKKKHLEFIPILMMREDYCSYPFNNNVNGVNGVYGPKALKVILRYMRKAVRIYIKVYGKPPKIIPWNEPAHYGSGEEFHRIMYNHEAVWEQVLRPKGGRLKDMWIDITLCEGAAGELIEPHKCPKLATCDRGGRHGKAGQNRKILGIKHGFTTLADFMVRLSNGRTKLENMIASGNHWRLYTEDGNGTIGDGRHVVRGYHMGDADQQYEMMLVLCQTWKKTGFMAKYGTFPHEALFYDPEANLFTPDYKVENINWHRIKNGVLRACQEVLE